jgi:HEAT repeat protein
MTWRLSILPFLMWPLCVPAQEAPAPRKELESEPEPGPCPATWSKATSALQKMIESKNAAGLAGAARELSAYDSADSATKLISGFLLCVRLFETLDAQDQKAIKAQDDELQPLIQAYVRAMTTQSTSAVSDFRKLQQKYRELLKAEEDLAERLLVCDRMVEDLLGALGALRTREATQMILKQAQSSFNLRYRARLIETLGSIRTASSVAGLIDILQKGGRDIEMLAAARGLRAIGVSTPETVAALAGVLTSEFRQIRVTAARALAELKCGERTEAIIDALKGTTGQTAADLNDALKKLTGVDKHSNVDAWKEWWARNHEAFLAGTYRPEALEKAGAAGSTTTFYGVPVVSTAVAFVIDTSGSMWEPARWVPSGDDEGRALGLKLPGNLKINIAQYELKKVLLRLPVDATVALVFFDGVVRVQAGGPVRLTESKRKMLVELVDGIKTPGGMTNLWGAVTKAHSYSGDAAAPCLKKDGIDTIYALTDGVPNVGVSETGKFLKRYSYLNRYLEVRVHTVQIRTNPASMKPGDNEEAEARPLLEGLATDAGGAFLQR